VQILGNLFGSHLDRLQKSMGLATKRHAALSNNLANVNTPGYKRQDVDFNLQLEEAMDAQSKAGSKLKGPNAGSSMRLDGNSVDLEQEVMSLAETELRYQALTDMTASYFAGLKNVIREGR
jgi:flagellar basal-body rod protein FlgB